MKSRSTTMRGFYVGVGLFLGNAVVLPLISETTFSGGIARGAISGAIAFAIFAIIDARKRTKSRER